MKKSALREKKKATLIPFVKHLAGVVSTALFLVSCQESVSHGNSFTIQGKFSGCTSEKIFLREMDINAVIPLDSAIADISGGVRFTRVTDQPGFYILEFPGKKKILLLTGKNETLDIKGDCRDRPEDFIIGGSPGTLLLAGFFRNTVKNKRMIDSVKTHLSTYEGSPDFLSRAGEADAAFRQIAEDQRKLELEFLQRNPNSLACLIVLNYSFGPKPILDIDRDFQVYKYVDSCLRRVYPDNKHVIYHHKRIAELSRQESVRKLQEMTPQRK
jgi:hypothetical protein